MDAGFEQQVRERAYEIWVAGGMEDGSANLHWLSAEQMVLSETIMPAAKSVKATKAATDVKASKDVKATKDAKAAKPRAKSVAGKSKAKSADVATCAP